ncbi:MAG: chemotaxis protein CheW [Gemmatimonadaceae bacterium]
MSGRLLVARLGPERIALAVADVIVVLDAPAVAPLPLMPDGVAGQLLVRDRWIPVLDTRRVLGIGRDGSGPGAALVFRAVRGDFALWVDDVEEVRHFSPAEERPVPAATERAGLLRALLWHDGRLIASVDTTALLGVAEDILHVGSIQ